MAKLSSDASVLGAVGKPQGALARVAELEALLAATRLELKKEREDKAHLAEVLERFRANFERYCQQDSDDASDDDGDSGTESSTESTPFSTPPAHQPVKRAVPTPASVPPSLPAPGIDETFARLDKQTERAATDVLDSLRKESDPFVAAMLQRVEKQSVADGFVEPTVANLHGALKLVKLKNEYLGILAMTTGIKLRHAQRHIAALQQRSLEAAAAGVLGDDEREFGWLDANPPGILRLADDDADGVSPVNGSPLSAVEVSVEGSEWGTGWGTPSTSARRRLRPNERRFGGSHRKQGVRRALLPGSPSPQAPRRTPSTGGPRPPPLGTVLRRSSYKTPSPVPRGGRPPSTGKKARWRPMQVLVSALGTRPTAPSTK